MPGHEVTVQGVVVLLLPNIRPRPSNVAVRDDGTARGMLDGFPGGSGTWKYICIGAERGEAMCDFALSGQCVRTAGVPTAAVMTGGTLKIGFVQNLVSTRRIASYFDPSAPHAAAPPSFRIVRDGNRVGNGLLDCGAGAPPWFQATRETVPPLLPPRARVPTRAGTPVVTRAFDNPRWSIPLSLALPGGRNVELKQVVLEDRFRLFAMVFDGSTYYPGACIEWGTDIVISARTGESLKAGSIHPDATSGRGRKTVWADAHWRPIGTTHPTLNGPTANNILRDKLVR